MFFNLKEASEHGVNVGTNWPSYTDSSIRFEDQHKEPRLQFVNGTFIHQYSLADKVIPFAGTMSALYVSVRWGLGTRST